MDGPAPDLPPRNHLLLALSPLGQARIQSKAQQVQLNLRDVLHTPDQPIEAVYFVETGWVSLVLTLDDGAMAEVGVIGREAMVGLSLLSGAETPFSEAIVQSAGTALRMGVTAFRRELDENPEFKELLLRCHSALLAQVSQTAACNSSHNLRQRLARWLLMAHDRTDGDVLSLTQEFLGMMLGAQRPSITVAAGQLQAEGAIRYSNGAIVIAGRARLEAAACGCYDVVQARYRQLLCH